MKRTPERTRTLALAALVLAACRGPAPQSAASAPATGAAAHRVGVVRSNIERGDYAGSAACARCHADISAAWRRSPMHNMTRVADGAEIHAPFGGSGGEFRFKDDRVTTMQRDGRRYLRIDSPRFGNHLFRVTRVIGGHHREDFAGVEVGGTDADAPGLGHAGEERVLPLSFMLGSHRFRYKGYSVMTPERPGLRPGAVWSRTCLFCHNTVPLLSTYLGALAGPGSGAYQGEMVDALLPAARRAPLEVLDDTALGEAVRRELRSLEGLATRPLPDDTPGLLREAVRSTRAHFDGDRLVEVGIGCESCHGGAREHVAHSGVLPSYAPRSPFLRQRLSPDPPAQDPDREPGPDERARQINRVCARCHQVLFSQYPWTWEGASRRGETPGGAHINSGEARDLLLGGCASRMSCVACHDPHAPDNDARMKALDGTPAGDAICVGCHGQYGTAEALRAHSHHAPEGAGARCQNCHMPKKNMSLDNKLSRYHRIGSPTAPEKVERDRPLECALCHADRTVAQLVGDMERWWGRRYDRAALQQLYGSLDDNVLLATLREGKAHEQATAIAVLGERGVRTAAPAIAGQLTHPYPIVRFYAEIALEQLLGGASPLDVHGDNAAIRAAADAWLRRSGLAPKPVGRAPTPPVPAPDPAD